MTDLRLDRILTVFVWITDNEDLVLKYGYVRDEKYAAIASSICLARGCFVGGRGGSTISRRIAKWTWNNEWTQVQTRDKEERTM